MSGETLQTIVVTLAALAAAATVIRRVFFPAKPPAGQAGCAGCPSAQQRCDTPGEIKAVAPTLIPIKRLTSNK